MVDRVRCSLALCMSVLLVPSSSCVLYSNFWILHLTHFGRSSPRAPQSSTTLSIAYARVSSQCQGPIGDIIRPIGLFAFVLYLLRARVFHLTSSPSN